MKRIFQAVCISIFLIFSKTGLFCADISNFYSGTSSIFDIFTQKFEGETAFRSLLIPSGGRFEGLGGTFTALSNDISFFRCKPCCECPFKRNRAKSSTQQLDSRFQARNGRLYPKEKSSGLGYIIEVFLYSIYRIRPVGAKKSIRLLQRNLFNCKYSL